MHGVVSLLDELHYDMVESIWREFKAAFGIHGVHQTPFPHYSYHLATAYDLGRLEPVLRRIAAEMQPFQVRTTGLGIFTGAMPVLYITTVRTPELTEFQRMLWHQVDSTSGESSLLYHPDNWIPHVTLAQGDVDNELLPKIVRMLSSRNFSWTVMLDNLSLIYEENGVQSVKYRFPFKG